MQFSVITADETETLYDGSFTVADAGVLVIHPEDRNEPLITLSPAFWRQIKAPRPLEGRSFH
jgi:hypothetical protein